MSPSSPLLDKRPLLIGVVHLQALPGAPGFGGRMGAVTNAAVADARALCGAGFDAVLVENFGDAPFHKDQVPPETIAAMATVLGAVREAVPASLALGVNVLRNDARAALAVAAAAELAFIRVNVLSGAAVTDQGVVEGRAADVLRDRQRLAPRVAILADVRVKHAAPLAPRPIEDEVHDLVTRGGADAVIVSGRRTGQATDRAELAAVRAAAGETPVLLGSGTTPGNIGGYLSGADGAIVGSSLKIGGDVRAAVDPTRAQAYVQAARAGRSA
jgi:membrane complex biogenesis BtpA family protein